MGFEALALALGDGGSALVARDTCSLDVGTALN